MAGALTCALGAFLMLAWVLHINARDRKRFERKLDIYLSDDAED